MKVDPKGKEESLYRVKFLGRFEESGQTKSRRLDQKEHGDWLEEVHVRGTGRSF